MPQSRYTYFIMGIIIKATVLLIYFQRQIFKDQAGKEKPIKRVRCIKHIYQV